LVNTSMEIVGIKFKNPVLTAAGPPSRSGEALRAAARGGAGGLVAKTVSLKPARVPRPCMAVVDRGLSISDIGLSVGGRFVRISKSMVQLPHGFLNAELWSDVPYQQWIAREYKLAKETGLPVIASIGYAPEEVSKLGPLVEKAGVDGIEFSTHYIGFDPKPFAEVAKALKESVNIPIFAKLSPHVQDISLFAKAVERYVDGVVAINTYGPALHIDIETGKPQLGSESGYGWLSGLALKPIAIRCVADVARAVKVPVMGVGGILSGLDAIEHIMAGAWAVQICTGAILEGPSIYGRVAKEIEEFLKKHGYDSLEGIRGIALKHLPSAPLRTSALSPKVDENLCTGCGICKLSCVYDAIEITEDPSTGRLFSFTYEDKCYGCGLCISICPQRARYFEEVSP